MLLGASVVEGLACPGRRASRRSVRGSAAVGRQSRGSRGRAVIMALATLLRFSMAHCAVAGHAIGAGERDFGGDPADRAGGGSDEDARSDRADGLRVSVQAGRRRRGGVRCTRFRRGTTVRRRSRRRRLFSFHTLSGGRRDELPADFGFAVSAEIVLDRLAPDFSARSASCAARCGGRGTRGGALAGAGTPRRACRGLARPGRQSVPRRRRAARPPVPTRSG
jgi:hypothetical protein